MSIHWFIISAVLVIIIQLMIFRRFSTRNFSYERSFNKTHCFEGDRVEMVERIANRKGLPIPWLRVESQLDSGLKFNSNTNFDVSDGTLYQNHKSLFSLMGYKQLTRRHNVLCSKRGCYRLTSAALTFGDLFGLHKKWIRIPLSEELIVYPSPIELAELNLPSRSWQGNVSVRRWIVEDPFYVTGVRDYMPGDSLKSINWSATARVGELQVHRRDYTADYKLMIVLNVEDHELVRTTVRNPELIERGIRYAAALVQFATEQGLAAGFATNGHSLDTPNQTIEVGMETGNDHMFYIYEQMAKLVISPVIKFDALLHQIAESNTERYDIVVLTAYMSEKIESALDKLRSEGHGVDLISIPEQAGDAA
ncbi:hypothetical protein PAECIP111893_01973 [Paenibacillus plantiphilus]|uniref:DUF58 domain-containing protein n=1 Tax=Paenibacillus plantiphilus TaxID=2905650 RepID=A0ABN8GEL4_9BACL|nr:DUF58 domain-containing protein [Paenibacillus plantiphilus]CAH1203459.1 hypothetical protein PAECIP111893_01973 [Paenibacillus plantiphilus]